MRTKGENYKSPKAKSRVASATRRRRGLKIWAKEKLKEKAGEASSGQSPTFERLKSIGRIRKFLQVWEEHTEEDEILDAVKGYGLSFVGDPVQGERRTRFTNPKDQEILREEVLKNLKKGIIE